MLPRCPRCWTHHEPDCDALDRIARSQDETVTYVLDTEGTYVADRGTPPPGFASWEAAEAWVRDVQALHTHESLGWRADVASMTHATLEAMWALPAKEA